MTALNTVEQGYFDHARGALPRFLFQSDDAPQDVLGAYAKIFGAVDAQVREWVEQAYIQSATGIFLEQHARDFGTSKRAGESEAVLRARIGKEQLVVTRPRLLQGADEILAAAGATTGAVMLEMRYDRAFFSDETPGDTVAFCSRGYRMGSIGLNGFVIILPAGASESVRASIDEYVRQAKAGGFRHRVDVEFVVSVAQTGVPFLSALGELRMYKGAHTFGHDLRDLLSRLGWGLVP